MATATRHLYVENGVGRRVVGAFNLFDGVHGWGAVFQNDIHPAAQRRQRGDEWWIEDATQQGYALLTKDLAIFDTPSEMDAVRASHAQVIGFARAQYTAWQMLGGLAFHWDEIAAQLDQPGPSLLTVYRGSTAPRVTAL